MTLTFFFQQQGKKLTQT